MNAHLIALATVLVWGVTFVSTKVLLVDFAPIEILFIRFLMGFAALCLVRRHILRTKKRSHELLFIAAGVTGVTLYYLLENVALVYANASVVGVVVAVSPLFTAIIGAVTGRERRLGLRFVAGFVVAMAGIAIVSLQGAFAAGPDGAISLTVPIGGVGDVLALLAAVVWSVYSTIVKRIADLGYETIASTKRTFAWGLLFMVPFLPIMGATPDVTRLFDVVNMGNLLFLGLVASAACFVTWGVAVRKLGAVRTSAYVYLVPVITVVASVIVLGEPFTLLTAAGLVLTVGGLFLSESSPKGKRAGAPAWEEAGTAKTQEPASADVALAAACKQPDLTAGAASTATRE